MSNERIIRNAIRSTGDIVHSTGDQVITGYKTFTQAPITPQSPSTNNSLTNRAYVLETITTAMRYTIMMG